MSSDWDKLQTSVVEKWDTAWKVFSSQLQLMMKKTNRSDRSQKMRVTVFLRSHDSLVWLTRGWLSGISSVFSGTLCSTWTSWRKHTEQWVYTCRWLFPSEQNEIHRLQIEDWYSLWQHFLPPLLFSQLHLVMKSSMSPVFHRLHQRKVFRKVLNVHVQLSTSIVVRSPSTAALASAVYCLRRMT